MDKVTIDGWVARDSSGELYLHSSMPHKREYVWGTNDNLAFTHELLNDLDFPQVRWEDNEPTPVTITIQIK